jgi:hypothetical protein
MLSGAVRSRSDLTAESKHPYNPPAAALRLFEQGAIDAEEFEQMTKGHWPEQEKPRDARAGEVKGSLRSCWSFRSKLAAVKILSWVLIGLITVLDGFAAGCKRTHTTSVGRLAEHFSLR